MKHENDIIKSLTNDLETWKGKAEHLQKKFDAIVNEINRNKSLTYTLTEIELQMWKDVFHIYNTGDPFEETEASIIEKISQKYSISGAKKEYIQPVSQDDIEQIIEQHCNQSSREAHYNAAKQIFELITTK